VIKAKLAKAHSKVHISFDGRTAPNHRAFIGIVAYWSDENLKTGLIGLQRIKGSHSGKNIAEAVLPVLKSFQLGSNLRFFIADPMTAPFGLFFEIWTQISKTQMVGEPDA
jgi:hypothetical protein